MSYARAEFATAVVLALALTSTAFASEPMRVPWGEKGAGYFNSSIDGFAESFAQGPNAIAPGADGTLLLADTMNDSVLVLGAGGKIVKRHGARRKPELARVSAVAAYGAGDILAGRMREGDILRIDSAGAVHPFFSMPAKHPDRIRQLQSLASDRAGRVYAGDVGGERIVILSSKGELLASVKWNLTGFVVLPDGTLLTLERRAGQGYALVARTAAGVRSDRFMIPTPGSGEVLPGDSDIGSLRPDQPVFASPRLLGVDGSGQLYLRHADPRKPGILMVRRYSSDGGSSSELGELPACGAEDVFAVTPEGRVLAMEYDAEAAPEGALVIRELAK